MERHPEPPFKDVCIQTNEELLLIKEYWSKPTFAKFKVTIEDWAKTPIYLMLTQGVSECTALMSQLPVTVIQRLVFDCTDYQKEKELELIKQKELNEKTDHKKIQITPKKQQKQAVSDFYTSLSSADDSDISETI